MHTSQLSLTRRRALIALALIIPLLGAGCLDRLTGTVRNVENKGRDVVTDAVRDRAQIACIKACKEFEKFFPEDLARGKCIDGAIQEGWACDAVHTPRDPAIDDLAENQCETFRNGTVNHFVEVDQDCGLVRSQ